jgi:hypothetical protein
MSPIIQLWHTWRPVWNQNATPLRKAFAAYLAPLRNSEWVVYSKRPFGGPEDVLRYLARYTHRVAISNRRLVALNDKGITFKRKHYRLEGPERYAVMTLDTNKVQPLRHDAQVGTLPHPRHRCGLRRATNSEIRYSDEEGA